MNSVVSNPSLMREIMTFNISKNLTYKDINHQLLKDGKLNPKVKLVGCTDYNTGKSIPDSQTEYNTLAGISPKR